jgi:hypothetical protein
MTQEQQTAKRPRGCFFYGCMSGVVVLVLLLIGGLVGVHYLKKMFTIMTDSAPVPLPTVKLSPTEMQQVHDRVENFRQAVQAGHPTEPLTLNSDEINALIATDPQMQSFKDKIYLSIEGDQLKGQLSVRLDQLGFPMFRTRYLNATGAFSLSLNNGTLVFRAEDITVKGKPLPEVYMEKIRKQNLAQGINQDPNASAALGKLEQIKVQDGKLVIVPKATQ